MPDNNASNPPTQVKRSDLITWLVGIAGGAIALGSALGRGVILRLDFVLLPHAPVPAGVWGLGPELPRRTPLMLPLAWLDPLVGSVFAGKMLVVACFALSFVGVCRLASGVAWPWRLAAGVLYAWGPFALTRLAVGHLFVLAAMAVLPWVLPTLLDPHRSRSRTYFAALALGLTGVLGGVFAIATVVTGCIGRSPRRAIGTVALVLLAQLPWLAPGVAVAVNGVNGADSRAFASDLGGAGGPLGLAVGQGFWQRHFQVGAGAGLLIALAALVLLALAVLGHPRLGPERTRMAALAGTAVAVVLGSGWRPFLGFYEVLTSLPGGASLREGQRVLPLALVWLAPAATHGAAVLAERPRWARWGAASFACVVALATTVPWLWGAGGQLDARPLPPDWEEVRTFVRSNPGTVLALPWFQYLDLDLAGGERVLNPLPLWLGGDVIASSNPRLPGGSGVERNDPREPAATRAVAASLRGDPVADDLAAIGIRWVVVLRDGDLLRGQRVGVLQAEALEDDPGLDLALRTDSFEIFGVSTWRGVFVSTTGRVIDDQSVATPMHRLDASGPATWTYPESSGWFRGFRSIHGSRDGLLRLPSGSGLVWYLPSVFVICSYLAVLSTGIWFKYRVRNSVLSQTFVLSCRSTPEEQGTPR